MTPSSESDSGLRTLEMAHVLFMDVVEYSRMLTDVQRSAIEVLQGLVRDSPEFQKATAAGRLVRLPTGDGMALVFFQDPSSPVQCALELSEALRSHPNVRVRMGINSGPVYRVADINTNANVSGNGINMAQRVMDCGDAGHILVTKAVADMLGQLTEWSNCLTDLGEQKVKHGVSLHVFNLCKGTAGNSKIPSRLRSTRKKGRERKAFVTFATIALLAGAAFWAYEWWTHRAVFESLAILPMKNTSGDPAVDFRSEAMTENLINTLGKLPKLRVISRSAVLKYRNKSDVDPWAVGKELGVTAILTGTVSQKGDHLVVTTELVDARNRNHLWGQTYDRLASEFSAIQEDISQDVTGGLGVKLSGDDKRILTRRYTNDPEAQTLYDKGRFFWNKRTQDDFKTAIDYFEQAIQKDPNFALAYTGLADTYSMQSSALSPNKAFPQAEMYAMKAVTADESLAQAHAALALIKLHYTWDWLGTEKEYKRAIELDPKYGTAHSMYAVYLMVAERFDEAYAQMKRAQQLDPNSLPISVGLARPLYLAGKYDEAIRIYRDALKMNPNFLSASYGLGLVYEQKGMVSQALAEYAKGPLFPDDAGALSLQGHAYALAGDKPKAMLALQKLTDMAKKRYVPPCEPAAVYAGLGDKDRMFENLNRCYDERDWEIIFLKVDPVFRAYRKDPRFVAIIKKLKLQ